MRLPYSWEGVCEGYRVEITDHWPLELLQADGTPYQVKRQAFGFDLTPKGERDGSTNLRPTHSSGQGH